jgi:hypothetical protein
VVRWHGRSPRAQQGERMQRIGVLMSLWLGKQSDVRALPQMFGV